MNAAQIRGLTDAELDQASGAEPNLGGYTYCVGDGLRVGPCPPTMDDVIDAFLDGFERGRTGQAGK